MINYISNWEYRADIAQVFDNLLTISLTQFAHPDCEWSKNAHRKATSILIKNKIDAEVVSAFFRDLILAYAKKINENGKADIIGNLYEQIQSKWKTASLGQFFTPLPICDIMSKITAGSNGVISEPTCGSGRILLSAHNLGLPYSLNNYYIGEDIDFVAVKMAALNFLIHGLTGEVIHHDTLKNPNSWDLRFKIKRHNSGLFYYEVDTKTEKNETKNNVQLSIF